MDNLPVWLGRIGGISGLSMLAYALWKMGRALAHPVGRQTGVARHVLRLPILLLMTLLFIAGGYFLWHPLPIEPGPTLHLVLTIPGALIYFFGLSLYLWGLRTLGKMFAPASGLGVRLQQEHHLVITGPYRYIRHPMYLAVILVCLGGLLIYWTWTMLIYSVLMLGLIVRAWREEQALAAEFGEAWTIYSENTPAWLPRVRWRN